MKKIWILLVVAAFAVGCSDKADEQGGDTPNQLSLSAETLTFLVDGTSVDGNNPVTVTSDGDWRIVGYESWCTPSATSGKSGDKVTFAVAENPANDARSAIYTFIRGNQAAKLTVSQLQNSVFDPILGTSYTVSSFQQTMTILVRTSFDFTPEIDVPWIADADVEQTRGVETRFLRFLVDVNEDYSDRTGKITVTDVEGVTHELVINQNQKHAILPSQKLYDVEASGGTITVSFQSNVDYTVSLSGYSWITEQTDQTRALTPSQKTFRIAESTQTRQGQIIVKYSPTDGAPALADTILVAQRAGQPVKIAVPDDAFRYFLRKNDYVLSKPGEEMCEMTAKGAGLTSMSCERLNIASLKGIEGFTSLTSLTCGRNDFTELDLFANTALTKLNCTYGMVRTLNMENCGALTVLTLTCNPLEELILSPTAPIAFLGLTALRDISSTVYSSKLKVVAPKITTLNCYTNRLTELDIAGCPALTNLSCYSNQLTHLDISANTKLKVLDCYKNQFQTLDMTANTALTTLACYDNQFEVLDLSANTALTALTCYNNQLKALDMSANTALTALTCYNNQLKTLDVSANTKLKTLDCHTNQLETLDVSANAALTTLYCYDNQFNALDITGCPALTDLGCYNNQLKALDVSANIKLQTLNCYENQLEALDVTTNTALTRLDCNTNSLKTLDVSTILRLSRLFCDKNPDLLTLYMAQNQTIYLLTKDEHTEIIRK